LKDYDFTPSKVNQQDIWRSVQVFSEREEDYPAMEKILKARGFSLKDVGGYDLFPAGTDKGPGVGLPLFSLSGICGYQRYHPDKKERYKTHGKRGIAKAMAYTPHLIICEGMFDCFTLYKALHSSRSRVSVCCLVGNQLTDEQLNYLLSISFKHTTFYIALDNDRSSDTMKMFKQIAPYRKVGVVTPSRTYGKDWDDAFRNYPAESLDWWRMNLGARNG